MNKLHTSLLSAALVTVLSSTASFSNYEERAISSGPSIQGPQVIVKPDGDNRPGTKSKVEKKAKADKKAKELKVVNDESELKYNSDSDDEKDTVTKKVKMQSQRKQDYGEIAQDLVVSAVVWAGKTITSAVKWVLGCFGY